MRPTSYYGPIPPVRALYPRRPGQGRDYWELQARALPTLNLRTRRAHEKRRGRLSRNLGLPWYAPWWIEREQ